MKCGCFRGAESQLFSSIAQVCCGRTNSSTSAKTKCTFKACVRAGSLGNTCGIREVHAAAVMRGGRRPEGLHRGFLEPSFRY